MKTSKNKNNFIADISDKLSRNTYVDYKTPQYFTDKQVMPYLGRIDFEEQQKSKHETDLRGYTQQGY